MVTGRHWSECALAPSKKRCACCYRDERTAEVCGSGLDLSGRGEGIPADIDVLTRV